MNITADEKITELCKCGNESAEKMYLFVCTGNSCRSPMAEALFNKKYAEGRRAESAGICAADSADISPNAKKALAKIGITDFDHTPRNVDEGLMRKADVIVGLTSRHASALIMSFPQFATKITSMPCDIPDPYGGSEEDYEDCLEMIDTALNKMLCNDENN